MVFTTEGFFEVAVESWPEWDLNPRPLLSVLRGKSLKDLLVRAKVPVKKETDGKSCGCQRKHCKVCTFLEEKNTFTNKEGSYI